MFNLFKSNKCVDGGNCHNFQPRYDEKSHPTLTKMEWGFDEYGVERVLNASRNTTTTYVKDVCVWCGKEILR